MREGNIKPKTFMILKPKVTWWEKLVPDFIIPNPCVLVKGIKSIEVAKEAIDICYQENR